MESLLIPFIHLGIGGVQRKIVDIINFFASYQPDLPIYILLRRRTNFDASVEIKNKNVKIITYSNTIPYFFPFFVIYQVWKLKPQSILAFLDFVSIPSIWAKLLFFWRRTRVVLSEDHYASRIISTFNLAPLRHLCVRIFYPLADAIFTCSQVTRQDLIKSYGIPEHKIKIIHNWTTLTPRRIKENRKKYDLIYVGRFAKTKNLGFLLEALRDLKRVKPKITFCLVGSGEEEEHLRKMVKKYHLEKNVEFVGAKYDVADFLAHSRVFVFSSQIEAEGLPLVILEAMAVGIPVLTREFAGVKEFFADGENCYLFKTEKEFIKKTLWLLNNPDVREMVAAQAYRYVKEHHSSQNILAYLRELELLKEEGE